MVIVSAVNGRWIETLIMPFPCWRFQWRDDGRWRHVDAGQMEAEAAGEHSSGEEEWAVWTGYTGCEGRAEAPEGRAEPTWWLLYGERPVKGEVRVRLLDGTELPIRTIGLVWACAWRSLKQPVLVEIAGRAVTVEFPAASTSRDREGISERVFEDHRVLATRRTMRAIMAHSTIASWLAGWQAGWLAGRQAFVVADGSALEGEGMIMKGNHKDGSRQCDAEYWR